MSKPWSTGKKISPMFSYTRKSINSCYRVKQKLEVCISYLGNNTELIPGNPKLLD